MPKEVVEQMASPSSHPSPSVRWEKDGMRDWKISGFQMNALR
jgi:hypothetical protein